MSERSKWSMLAFVVLLIAMIGAGVQVWGQAGGPSVTLKLPGNVYRPSEFTVWSEAADSTIEGISYSNVRFNITVSGPESFTTYARADVFTITEATPWTGVTLAQAGAAVTGTFVNDGDNFLGYWGPAGGFPMADIYPATACEFTVEMNNTGTAPLGEYTVTVDLVNVISDVVLATAQRTFTLSDNSLYVGTTGYEYQFSTIQAAIDSSVAGDTINVAAGTYVEQVEITIDLTLEGAGSGTVVQSPDTLTKYFTTSANNYPIIYVHDANDVTIQDLVVDGAGKGNANNRFLGIGYHNAGGTVDSVELKDVRDTPFSGAQHGVALYVYNEDDASRSITVSSCNFHDFQKNAMALNASVTTPLAVSVHDNQITGYGATDVTAQNGVQVYADLGTGTVADNTVTGIAYDNTVDPTKWVATSILNYYADLDITGNTISNGHMGIYNIDGAGQINSNNVTIVKVGVYAFGIIASDPPEAVPSPFGEDGAALHALGGAKLQAATTLNVTVSGNTVAFSGPDNTDTFGIEADAGWGPNNMDFTAQNNTVTGFDVGIEIYKCESGCDTGVFTNVKANYNSISGNTIGLRSNVDYLTVDAENNWWGDASGPAHIGNTYNVGAQGNAVSNNVDYVTWLNAAPPSGLAFAPVTKNSVPTYYASIQAALDAASDGDTITCAAGTFTEDLVINVPNLELKGAGATTIIQGVQQADAGFPQCFPNIDITGDGVKLHDFTIRNPQWQDGYWSFGTVVGATSVEIYNVVFEGATSDDLTDVSQCFQTWNTVDISGLNLHDNTFTTTGTGTTGYEAVYINTGGTGSVTIKANTFDGKLLRAITTVRENATITDNMIITTLAPGTGATNAWAGINVDAANVTVSNNEVYGTSGFGVGIDIGKDGVAIQDVVVNNNTVGPGNDTGIRVRGNVVGTGVNAQNNNIEGNLTWGVDASTVTGLDVDATNCWWGSVTGPDGEGSGNGDDVSTNVDYIPWLGAAYPGGQPVTLPTVTLALPAFLVQDVPEWVQFSATIDNPADGANYAGVYADILIEGPSALAADNFTLQYLEVVDGQWHDLPLQASGEDLVFPWFGPSPTGFPLAAPQNYVTQFRVKASGTAPVGTYDVTVGLRLANPGECIATGTGTTEVVAPPSVQISNWPAGDPNFVVGGAYEEFTIQTTNPSDGGNYAHVLFNFRIIGPASSTLTPDMFRVQYAGSWHDLTLTADGDDLIGTFGPAGGFPMGPDYNETTTFRAKAQLNAPVGNYTLEVTLVYLDPDPDWDLAELTPVKDFTVGVSATATSMDLDTGWNMISVPLIGDDVVPETVFSDVIDSGQPLVIYEWVQGSSYHIPTAIDPGKGYWLYLFAPVTVGVSGIAPTGDYDVTLGLSGWQQISTPRWPVAWVSLSFNDGTETKTFADAIAAGWILQLAFWYDATTETYQVADLNGALDPWKAYWIFTTVDNLVMTLPLDEPYIPGPQSALSIKAVPEGMTPPPPPVAPPLSAGMLQFGNTPNPIRNVHTTTFAVKGALSSLVEAIKVEIFDQAGRLVYESGEIAGASVDWHTDNDYGEYLANGVYLYKMYARVNGKWIVSEVKKLAILR